MDLLPVPGTASEIAGVGFLADDSLQPHPLHLLIQRFALFLNVVGIPERPGVRQQRTKERFANPKGLLSQVEGSTSWERVLQVRSAWLYLRKPAERIARAP
jgi:hypothetical protein